MSSLFDGYSVMADIQWPLSQFETLETHHPVFWFFLCRNDDLIRDIGTKEAELKDQAER